MPGNVSVDTQKLQNIKTALQQFNTSMQSNSAGIISYIAEKKSEVESNLRKRLKQFEVNESYRRQAEYNADDDSRADVLAENSRQRQRETEELNDLKSLIRAFGSVSSELEHHLKAMAGTHSETVAKGASTLEKSIQILEEYFAIPCRVPAMVQLNKEKQRKYLTTALHLHPHHKCEHMQITGYRTLAIGKKTLFMTTPKKCLHTIKTSMEYYEGIRVTTTPEMKNEVN